MIKEREFELAQERIYSVVQKNDLIRNYLLVYKPDKPDNKNNSSISLAGQRLFLYLVSKIKPDATKFEGVRIEIKSFCELIGIQINGKNYKDFREAVESLWKASFIELGTLPPKELRILSYRTPMGASDPGTVELKLNDDLLPYLVQLRNNYTQFSLHDVIKMKSQYSMRLYPLLRSYFFTGSPIRFSLHDLKENLDATQYTNLKDFKNRVLAPALDDIEKYSSEFSATVEYEKSGRTTTHVVFTLSGKDPEASQDSFTNVEREIDPDQLIIDDFPEAAL